MTKFIYMMLIILFCFFSFMSWGYLSLFGTVKEVQLIQKKEEMAPEDLYLAAIIYVDKDHWTLWVNHQTIHSSNPQRIQGYFIEKVTPLTVEFSYLLPKSAVPIRFVLRSHQMFLRSKQAVLRRPIDF